MQLSQTQHIIRTLMGLSGLNYKLRKLRNGKAKNLSFLKRFLPFLVLIPAMGIAGAFVAQTNIVAHASSRQKINKIQSAMEGWLDQVTNTLALRGKIGPAGSVSACALTQTVRVSGCYYSNGASRAMVSVEVSWTGAVSGDVITVSLDNGAQTRTINPEALYSPDGGPAVAGPLVSPQIVSFEITTEQVSHTVASSLSGASTCAASSNPFFPPTGCAPNLCTDGELGGTVFFDLNGDGQRQAGEITGASGVTVRAFDSANQLVSTATSDSAGRYEFSAANSNAIAGNRYPLRLEFSNLPALSLQTTSRMGDNNGSSVQFVSAAQCNADIGVIDTGNYCRNNPLVVVPCYVNGDPLPAGTSGDGDSLVAFPYNSTGGPGPALHLAIARQTGSLWGVAYNRFTNRIFSAAFLKRHAGLGPLGLGGIYASDPSALTTNSFIDVATLGIDVGQASVPSNAARGLDPSKVLPNHDTAVFSLVGKVGIGGLDLSEDGNTLWMVNLHDKKIYSINIAGYNANNTLPTAANVASATIPNPGCTGGGSRPFALKVHNGSVFVGTVCDGSSGTRSDLKATIFAYNPQTQNWSTEFSFPLTYHKGSAYLPQFAGWYTWTDNFADMTLTSFESRITHSAPILLDLEFDLDGSMLIGLGDRTSLQLGYDNYGPVQGNLTFYASIISGDVLRAFYSNNSYHLENNGKAGPYTGAFTNNNQGPGAGEFYDDNFVCCHDENFQGGLAFRPGSSELIAVTMDPVKNLAIVNAAGIRTLNNFTGASVNNFYLFSSSLNSTNGLFGKGASLGDAELVCRQPEFLEIGNRVWMDSDFDGIQDPAEMPIAGLTVRLYREGGPDGILGNGDDNTPVATAVTSASGNYRFTSLDANDDNAADSDADLTDSLGLVGGPGLLPNTRYVIRADRPQDYTSGGAVFGKLLTFNDTDTGTFGTTGDLHDSDATTGNILGLSAGNFPEIEVKHLVSQTVTNGTGQYGQVDHTFDFGFAPQLSLGNLVWKDFNNDGVHQNNEPGIANVTLELWRDNGDNTFNSASDSLIATTQTDANGLYQFTGLEPNDYFVRIPASNFGNGNPLGLCLSSSTTTADPDNNVDNDDNGIDNPTPANGGIVSGEIELDALQEPDTGADGNDTNGNNTVDFGFVINTMSLGNLVWKDANQNGTREPSETGVANVKLNLYRDNGDSIFNAGSDQLLGMTTTNASGNYFFQNLLPGNYFVQVDASNFASNGALYRCLSTLPSTQANNDLDNDNNGANNSNPVTAPPTSSLVTLVQDTEPTTDGDGNNGNNTVDFGFLSPLMTIVENGGSCIGSGTAIEVQSQLINAGDGLQNDNPGPEVVIDLPPTLAAVAGSCQSQGGNGTCVVNSVSQIVWNGSLPKGSRLTLTYLVQGTNLAVAGTDMCFPVTANFDADLNGSNETPITTQSCIRADCTPTGPGIQTDPGCSVLIYPIYTSNPTNPGAQNTRINITNINPTIAQTAHMFFVDGSTCSISDSYICLTANQTTSFVLSDLDPGTTGYLIVVTVDPATGCPINSNYLIGDEYVKFESGHAANLKAECIVALPGGLPACNQDSFTAQLRFDGISYSMLPRAVALSNLADRTSGNDTMLILDSLNGNLWTGLDRLGAIFGIAYDDAETPASFSFNPGTCQFRNSISNSFPRTTPRIETLIPAGRSGWMKMWLQSDAAIIGAAITYNPSLSNASGAFVQGHNLHKLTLTPAASMTIPVFPPAC